MGILGGVIERCHQIVGLILDSAPSLENRIASSRANV